MPPAPASMANQPRSCTAAAAAAVLLSVLPTPPTYLALLLDALCADFPFTPPARGLIGRNFTPLHRRGRRAGRWCWSRPFHQMTIYRCLAPRRRRVPGLGAVPRAKREQPPPASRTSWLAFASTARSDGARSPAAAAATTTIRGTRPTTRPTTRHTSS